jgi:hypothetical protein
MVGKILRLILMDDPQTPHPPSPGPRSQLGIYRSWLTSPEHLRHITVGRDDMLRDTLETLRGLMTGG